MVQIQTVILLSYPEAFSHSNPSDCVAVVDLNLKRQYPFEDGDWSHQN